MGTTEKKPAAAPTAGAPASATGAAAVPQGAKKPASGESSKKGWSPLPGGCHAWGCKSPEKRFTFCDEHYDQFKFGLIKKSGEPVSDFEKKFEHYQAYLLKRKAAAHKVA